MNKCTFCGRLSNDKTKFVEGYEILEHCTDCEDQILEGKDERAIENTFNMMKEMNKMKQTTTRCIKYPQFGMEEAEMRGWCKICKFKGGGC